MALRWLGEAVKSCLLHFPARVWLWAALGGLIPPAADDRKRGHSWRGSSSARRNPRGGWLFQSKQGRPGKAELRMHDRKQRAPTPVRCSCRWSGYWAGLKDHAPSGAPALALYQSPAARRPIRTHFGTPNRRTSGPRFLPLCTRPSRGPPRSLPVVPLIGDKRYYGEAPMCIR
jgi:hypothetical protein